MEDHSPNFLQFCPKKILKFFKRKDTLNFFLNAAIPLDLSPPQSSKLC